MRIVIGARGSPLALAQANWISQRLLEISDSVEIEIKVIKTRGDQILNLPVEKIGDKGVFIKELETALQNRDIDLAVHSAKDLPAEIPEELILGAFPEREDPYDVLIAENNEKLETLPLKSVIGTSALRRQSQLLNFRPDLKIELLRGNVETRIRKLDEGKYSGIILAKAGLNRLGIKRGTPISRTIMLPSPAQGALAVEMRRNDTEILAITTHLNDEKTSLCVQAERSFLAEMQGGCQLPLGAIAELRGSMLFMEGFIGSPDGKNLIRKSLEGEALKPIELGKKLASLILSRGGSQIRNALS
ncbi:MAG: hydroxymethylbilane synthase [Firmicutes bacterium]|nr:hydroxymethylbilane synthase [Bacillota bacterium]